MSKVRYIPTIGLECHVQLSTKTKLFSGVEIKNSDSEPNLSTSAICLGMPGTLPVLNRQAVVLAVRAAYALNTKPQNFSKFDRKHYFYPDLPKGYQITQYDQPIILGGYVEFKVNGNTKKVDLVRAHLEEDAGKTIHPAGKDFSLVDLNRAGTPLLEIVTEPCMHSAEEARAFAHELYLIVRYAGVSDADLYHGNMRFDVNVSISKDPNKLGTRTETKNLNSFRSVEKAIEYEIKRQTEILEKGHEIIQETRGWDDAKQKTFSQRGKEEAHDYRYFPEPDLPPLVLDEKFIKNALQDEQPLMPNKVRDKLYKLELSESSVETLIDAQIPALFMLGVIDLSDKTAARRIANWLTTDAQALIASSELRWEDMKLNKDSLLELSKLISENKINSTSAKAVFIESITTGEHASVIAKNKNMLQVSDERALNDIINRVILENSKAAEAVKKGEDKAIKFLVGQVMKLSKGQANPSLSQELIKKKLKN